MSLTFTVANPKLLGKGVWLADIPPHEVRFIGASAPSIGTRSVILAKSVSYESNSQQLKFAASGAAALNIGTQTTTVIISADGDAHAPSATSSIPQPTATGVYGPGDREFLSLLDRLLPADMQAAGRALLDGVRRQRTGDLKRGKKNNFSETPDNYWYVIVQPQVRHLQITVRGDVTHFQNVSRLEILDDRGNTRFKIKSVRDVPDALKLIFHAKRKA